MTATELSAVREVDADVDGPTTKTLSQAGVGPITILPAGAHVAATAPPAESPVIRAAAAKVAKYLLLDFDMVDTILPS